MIRVDSLKLGYGLRTVLADLNFQVAEGDFVGLLGPNGSGKSTLLKALAGLLPPQEGRIRLDSQDLSVLPSRRRALLLAVVPQSSEVRFPFTCLEVVLMGRYPHRRRHFSLTDEDLLWALWAMRLTDTESLQDRPVTEVSGGEGQRVVLARTLAQNPRLMLLDEATSSLDVRRKMEIFAVLSDLNRTQGLTLVCAMHDLNLAALFCRRLIFLKDNHILAYGPTEEVFRPEILAQVYDTEMEVVWHPRVHRPYAVMLPLRDDTPRPAFYQPAVSG